MSDERVNSLDVVMEEAPQFLGPANQVTSSEDTDLVAKSPDAKQPHDHCEHDLSMASNAGEGGNMLATDKCEDGEDDDKEEHACR